MVPARNQSIKNREKAARIRAVICSAISIEVLLSLLSGLEGEAYGTCSRPETEPQL
jgi:hypothetical protein